MKVIKNSNLNCARDDRILTFEFTDIKNICNINDRIYRAL